MKTPQIDINWKNTVLLENFKLSLYSLLDESPILIYLSIFSQLSGDSVMQFCDPVFLFGSCFQFIACLFLSGISVPQGFLFSCYWLQHFIALVLLIFIWSVPLRYFALDLETYRSIVFPLLLWLIDLMAKVHTVDPTFLCWRFSSLIYSACNLSQLWCFLSLGQISISPWTLSILFYKFY